MPEGGEEAARAFYAGILGLTEVEKPEPMRATGGVWFAEGIHLSGEAGFSPPRRAHPALRVDDLDALAEALAAAGCEVTWDERWPGVRRFYTGIRSGTDLSCSQMHNRCQAPVMHAARARRPDCLPVHRVKAFAPRDAKGDMSWRSSW